MIKNKELKRRIVEISYKLGLSHVGSCLTAVDIIKGIYETKRTNERFILSAGHAGLAWYTVIEAFEHKSAEAIFNHHGVHPDRCNDCGLSCSTGSLGHGIGIAVGMALADRKKNVYCLLSDGECAEGSVYEAIRIAKDNFLTNLKVYVNFNNYAAYKETQYSDVIRLTNMLPLPPTGVRVASMSDYPKWLQGQIAHYKVLNKAEYEELIVLLS